MTYKQQLQIYKPFSIQLSSVQLQLILDSCIVRPANGDWACQTERCHTLSNKTSQLQLAYLVYARSESPGEVMHTCSLVGAFPTRRRNKNHHLVC